MHSLVNLAPSQRSCYAVGKQIKPRVRRAERLPSLGRMTAHLTHAAQPARDRCAACGRLLTHGYFFLRDRSDRYCPECIAARQLYDETVAAVAAQLGLALRVGVEFRLVDAPTLTNIRAEGSGEHTADEKTLGLYQRQGRLRAIYLLYGLPKLLFRTVVAHEYAHAWQAESCPLLEDDSLREGFAEWVAYRHLLYLGCTRAAQRMLASSHPYRPLLEQVLALEERVGPAGVLQHILEVGRGVAA